MQPVAEALRSTGPLKLPRLVSVIVVFSDWPAGIETLLGFAERENPWTFTVTVVCLVVLPLVPVIVTM